MSKSIIIGLVTAASLLGVAAANAREVCRTVSIPTMNCTPTKCFVTYTTAQICKQVPDTPPKNASKAATRLTKSGAAQGSFKPVASRLSGLGARTATFRR